MENDWSFEDAMNNLSGDPADARMEAISRVAQELKFLSGKKRLSTTEAERALRIPTLHRFVLCGGIYKILPEIKAQRVYHKARRALGGEPPRRKPPRWTTPNGLRIILLITPTLAILGSAAYKLAKLESRVEVNQNRSTKIEDTIENLTKTIQDMKEQLVRLKVLVEVNEQQANSGHEQIRDRRAQSFGVEERNSQRGVVLPAVKCGTTRETTVRDIKSE